MAGGTVSRTAHFVLHRAALDAASGKSPGSGTERSQTLFAVCDEPWIGAVVPKRWARRAVTRSGIKRQIYNVSAQFEPRLSLAAHVVRLRSGFGKDEFKSAWSEPLKIAVRSELMALFDSIVTPAKAGVQRLSGAAAKPLDSRLRGNDDVL